MLELTGKCCSGIEAIEFLESLEDVIDEEIKTNEFYGLRNPTIFRRWVVD